MPETLNEWSALVERWREDERPALLASLRHRIAAQRRRMWWCVAAEVSVSVAYVAVVTWALWSIPGAWARLFAADVALLLVAAWAFALWNRRGTWRPLGETTESYLALSRLRCRRRLQAIRFGWVLLAAQVTTVAAWVLAKGAASPFPRSVVALLLPLAVVIGFAWALDHGRRRVTRELAELAELAELDTLDQE